MFKFKHVSLYEGAPDLLIGPCDEQFVVVISLKMKSSTIKQNNRKASKTAVLACKHWRATFSVSPVEK